MSSALGLFGSRLYLGIEELDRVTLHCRMAAMQRRMSAKSGHGQDDGVGSVTIDCMHPRDESQMFRRSSSSSSVVFVWMNYAK